MIDKEYEGFNYSGDKWFSFQSKLDAYRKEVEAQMQAEMNAKVHIFFSIHICILISVLKGINALWWKCMV